MQVNVEFVDSTLGHSWTTELSERDEIFVNDVWYKEDSLLVELCDQELFRNKTTWSDLELIHYQLLLMKCFDHLGPNPAMDDITLRYKEPFLTFRFFASCVVKMARIDGLTGFDTLTIARPKENRILIDFRKTFKFDWNEFTPPNVEPIVKKHPFQLIVDNTKTS